MQPSPLPPPHARAHSFWVGRVHDVSGNLVFLAKTPSNDVINTAFSDLEREELVRCVPSVVQAQMEEGALVHRLFLRQCIPDGAPHAVDIDFCGVRVRLVGADSRMGAVYSFAAAVHDAATCMPKYDALFSHRTLLKMCEQRGFQNTHVLRSKKQAADVLTALDEQAFWSAIKSTSKIVPPRTSVVSPSSSSSSFLDQFPPLSPPSRKTKSIHSKQKQQQHQTKPTKPTTWQERKSASPA